MKIIKATKFIATQVLFAFARHKKKTTEKNKKEKKNEFSNAILCLRA